MDTTQTELGRLYVALLNTESKAVYEELQLLIAKQKLNMGGKSHRKTSRKKSTKKRKQKKAKKSRSKKI